MLLMPSRSSWSANCGPTPGIVVAGRLISISRFTVGRGREIEATAGVEPAIGVLQTPALPLGYVAPRVRVIRRGIGLPPLPFFDCGARPLNDFFVSVAGLNG